MPRTNKPFGRENWTWAEINAGRRFNKAERRWNHMARQGGWEQRPNGTYKIPAELQPVFAVLLVVILGIGVVAPNGLQSAEGDGKLVGGMLLVGFCVFALVWFGVMSASDAIRANRAVLTARRRTADAGLVVGLTWLLRAVSLLLLIVPAVLVHLWTKTLPAGRARFFRLPEWTQASLAGAACSVPPVALIIYLFVARRPHG